MHSLRLALFAVALTLIGCSEKPNAAAENGQTPPESATPYEDLHGKLNCAPDCSGREAGYRWAQEHEILSTGECAGQSQSFIDGCQSYLEDAVVKK